MHHPCQQFIGIATSLVYFQAGVTATQTLQGNPSCHPSINRFLFLIFQCGSDINATGTTDIKFPFILGVKVQQDFAFQCPGLQTECTVHAGFFILGYQSFQRTVFQSVVFKDCHDSSDPQTIVSSQRSALCLYPITVNIGFDGIFCKVMNGIVIFLRHHIHVRLQDDALAIFHTRSGRLTDNDISDFIDK